MTLLYSTDNLWGKGDCCFLFVLDGGKNIFKTYLCFTF